MPPLTDPYGRTHRDLRISVTDRCNLRCLYCLPDTEAAANLYQTPNQPNPKPIQHTWKPPNQILTLQEIHRLAKILTQNGIQKIRLTGGEPLLRKNLPQLTHQLAQLPNLKDLALTTNGTHFPKHAQALKNAGLRRITISLDTLNHKNYKQITGKNTLNQTLQTIQLAKQLNLQPIKINAVIIRNINDHEIETLTHFAQTQQITIRFIEYMPLDAAKKWQKKHVLTAQEILTRLQKKFHLTPIHTTNPSETAQRWTINHTQAQLGIIAPVTQPFCHNCNRLRLTADGKIRTCLFTHKEHDLKPLLRNNATDQQITQHLHTIITQKQQGHRIGKPDFKPPTRTMSAIGG